jgi:hypothetical protein
MSSHSYLQNQQTLRTSSIYSAIVLDSVFDQTFFSNVLLYQAITESILKWWKLHKWAIFALLIAKLRHIKYSMHSSIFLHFIQEQIYVIVGVMNNFS